MYTINYQRAENRINETPALEPYREICLHDWPQGDEHYQWVAEAKVSEIIDWAETIAGDNAYMVGGK